MIFPDENPHWTKALHFFQRHAREKEILYAPNEFLRFHALTYPLNYLFQHSWPLPDWVLFHKAWKQHVSQETLDRLQATCRVVWTNEAFIILVSRSMNHRSSWTFPRFCRRLPTLKDPSDAPLIYQEAPNRSVDEAKQKTGILITTYNRPWALARSLPSILALATPVLVVNDGSDPSHQTDYRKLYALHASDHLQILELPANRGLSAAINIGLAHWLAAPEIEWISYFQDDVEVKSETLKLLETVRHPTKRPVLSGYLSKNHSTIRQTSVQGIPVHLRQSNSGVHIDAHRSYWEQQLPIPTVMLGAPKVGYGADEDWWVLSWSPKSAAKTNRFITCLPDLVHTFAQNAKSSTWGNSDL